MVYINPGSPDNKDGDYMAWVKFAICFFLGFLGVHKFLEKKIGMGLLYLFTMGLFGFGWLYDCGKYLIAAVKYTNSKAGATSNSDETVASVIPGSHENRSMELSPIDPMNRAKKALLWIVTVFFFLAALVYLPSGDVLAGLLASAFVALVIPVERWQNTVRRYIKGRKKAIIAIGLAVLCFATAPVTGADEANNIAPTVTAAAPTETFATESVTEATSEPTTESTAETALESTTEATAEATTEPATESTNVPITESTINPTEDSGKDYVVNTSTGKFHYPSCASVNNIAASNRWDYHGTRDKLISMGYVPCKRCCP